MHYKSHIDIKRFQIFSGAALKKIATTAMFIDHFSKIILSFISNTIWVPMRLSGAMTLIQYSQIDEFIRFTLYEFGELAFPLFSFLISEGYHNTHNRKKYIQRMLLFALISELPFDLCFFSDLSAQRYTFPFFWRYQNIFFTYLLSLICLVNFDKIEYSSCHSTDSNKYLVVCQKCLNILFFSIIADLIKCDYGAMGIILITSFYLSRHKRIAQACILIFLSIISTGNEPSIFTILAAFFILLYNGSKGKYTNQFFFYWFYPLHILALYLSKIILHALLK